MYAFYEAHSPLKHFFFVFIHSIKVTINISICMPSRIIFRLFFRCNELLSIFRLDNIICLPLQLPVTSWNSTINSILLCFLLDRYTDKFGVYVTFEMFASQINGSAGAKNNMAIGRRATYSGQSDAFYFIGVNWYKRQQQIDYHNNSSLYSDLLFVNATASYSLLSTI